MQIGTKVFKRVVAEQKAAAIVGIADIMAQTYRFGGFDRKYLLKCAKRFHDETLKAMSERAINNRRGKK